jgi:branched-subunit amino acid transport protein
LADAWVVVIALIATTAFIKASGPVLLGGRDLPRPARAVIALLAAALLSALVVTETFRDDESNLTLDERALGVGAAGLVLLARGPLLVAMAVAMAVTAGARALL